MTADTYIIQGGAPGRERLRLLSRVMRPTTMELFDRIGLQPDWTCLDVGCGGGDVSCDLARMLGENARVIGMDVDAEKLALARSEAQRAGLTNVEFQLHDFCGSGGPADFDFLYARFVLSHLPDPLAALRQMRKFLKPGATFAAEDTDFRAHFCHPPHPAHETYVRLFSATARRRGANPDIGAELPGLLREAGFSDIHVRIVQPCGYTGEVKLLSPLTLENIAASVVDAGLADEQEVNKTIAQLYEVARDETTFMSIPRVVQVWARN